MYCKCNCKRPGEVGSHYGQIESSRAGVTLIELMVVIAIIALVAAVALPSLRAFSSRKAIFHQADQIGAQLYRAKELAVTQGIPWRVVFSPGPAQWYCFGDLNRNMQHDPGEQRLGPYVLTKGILFGSRAPAGPNNSSIPADGVSFSGNRVSFSPMGTCNAGTIYLRSTDRDLALRVLPASGLVLMYEKNPSWRVLR